MRIPCIRCKGRYPSNCGRSFCPVIAKSEAQFKVKGTISKESFGGSAPAPFVGRFGYPNINVGILAPPDIKDSSNYDAPRDWARTNTQIPEIANLRSALVNSRFKTQIKAPTLNSIDKRFLDISMEVGMASKPVDIEIDLIKRPVFRLRADSDLAPMGPNASLKKVRVTSNPKVHTKVDKVVSDSDRKAASSLSYLYRHDFDENFLAKVLSVGNLGVKKDRKLVPTRWSITAVDDILGKDFLKHIRDFQSSDNLAFFGSYLGNYYLVLLFPGVWGFELFEMYASKNTFGKNIIPEYATDHEFYSGRSSYAENCAGGYYSVRLAVFEKLRSMKRQATVLVIRVITGEYAMPLGVWVTREAARKALSNKPISFSDDSLMINYAKILIRKKFGFDVSSIMNNSILLKDIKSQARLSAFF